MFVLVSRILIDEAKSAQKGHVENRNSVSKITNGMHIWHKHRNRGRDYMFSEARENEKHASTGGQDEHDDE